MSRTIVKSLLLILFVFLGHSPEYGLLIEKQSEQTMSWDDIISAYNAYLSYPSPEHARALAGRIPNERLERVIGDESRALDYILSAENFGVLAIEAENGNKYSLETLIRLLNFVDGFGAEEVLGVLGIVVRTNPRLFLETLTENLDNWHVKQIGLPVEYPAYAYNNHPGAYKYDLEKRVASLESVNDPRYAKLKKACIQKLKEEIGHLK
jgi:hypothetical protein